MTDVPDPPKPVDRFTWERCIRRAPLAPELKYVALMMATYAGTAGSEVRPGDVRLAADCEKGIRTIERNRRALIEAGFLEQLSRRRRGEAAEYQLTIPSNFHDLPGVRGPDGGPGIELP